MASKAKKTTTVASDHKKVAKKKVKE